MKRNIKDDLGSTIDSEDNLAKMIMIEQAIEAAEAINDSVSKSYAYSDCIFAILDFARETNNLDLLERADELLEKMKNKGARTRTLSYMSFIATTFNLIDVSENYLKKAVKTSVEIKDDFDRRDAFLEIATSACDIYAVTRDPKMIDTALNFEDQLTKGQRAYLFGYLSIVLENEDATNMMKKAISIAERITDPITKSKVYLELAALLSSFQKSED